MANDAGEIRIRICYAKPEQQFLREVTVAAGANIEEAIRRSGILSDLGGLDLASCRIGIYGKIKTLDAQVRDGDRIEIYRALLADPKDARRKRAQKKK